MKPENKFAKYLIVLISLMFMGCATKIVTEKVYCPAPQRPEFALIRSDLSFDSLENVSLFMDRHNQTIKYLKDLENVIKCYESEDVGITKK